MVLTARASAMVHTRRSSSAHSRQREGAAAAGAVDIVSPFLAWSGRLESDAMRTRLERTYRFEAAHFLPKVPEGHKCARMHGHSYVISVAVEGEVDSERGWLMDFAEIDEHVMPLVRLLDHRVMNEIDGLDNPTSEHLAVWLWRKLEPSLPVLVEVGVAETTSSRCLYRGE